MKDTRVLVPGDDHSYREASLKLTKVVWNTQTQTYSEYAGDDYLESGEFVVERLVAQ